MESGRLPGQACDVPILQARQSDGAFVPGRPPLPTAPLPFRLLFAAFFMAPGGQAAQGGLPEPKLEWIQLPTVSNLRGAGALRARGGERTTGYPGAAGSPRALLSGWPPGGRSWATVWPQGLSGPRKASGGNISVEKQQNLCRGRGGSLGNPAPGSQWVHHPSLENN